MQSLQINRILTICLAMLTVLATATWAQVERVEDLTYPPLPEVKIPQPTRVVLPNGMVVFLIEDHELPLVGVSAKIRTGARLEPVDKVGLAGLTGTVLRSGGTTTRSGNALDEYLEGKAASVETSIGQSSGSASMSCLAEDFPEVLKVFGDVLRHPAFDPEKLAIAKNQVIAGIARQNDNPGSIVSREYRKLIYGKDSPYAWQKTYATVRAITREDLVAWHQKYFHPNRIILGLVGDFQTDKALALVKEVFGNWDKNTIEISSYTVVSGDSLSIIAQRHGMTWQELYFHSQNKKLRLNRPNPKLIYPGDVIRVPTEKVIISQVQKSFKDAEVPYQKENEAGAYFVEKNDMTQAKIVMGHLGLMRTHPDYYPVVIMNQILSGSFGARLFSNVRSKKGLAYDVYGAVGFGWDYPGSASLSMSTKTETTGPGIDALLEEVHKIMETEPPTKEEVSKAKAGILNSFVFSVDSPGKVLGKVLVYEYYGYPLDWLTRFRKGIEQVTTDQVREAARTHLRPERFAILVVGPREGTKPALARYESVTELDISIPES